MFYTWQEFNMKSHGMLHNICNMTCSSHAWAWCEWPGSPCACSTSWLPWSASWNMVAFTIVPRAGHATWKPPSWDEQYHHDSQNMNMAHACHGVMIELSSSARCSRNTRGASSQFSAGARCKTWFFLWARLCGFACTGGWSSSWRPPEGKFANRYIV